MCYLACKLFFLPLTRISLSGQESQFTQTQKRLYAHARQRRKVHMKKTNKLLSPDQTDSQVGKPESV